MPRRFRIWNGDKITERQRSHRKQFVRLQNSNRHGDFLEQFLADLDECKLTRESVRHYRSIYENIVNKITMAVEFDHMYIGCADSKTAVGNEIQVKQLKDMMLLNLEIIKQQAEQIVNKDKIIKELSEENKNLKAKIERIDRRVSLSLQRNPEILSVPLQVDVSETQLLNKFTKIHSPNNRQKLSPIRPHRSLESPTTRKNDRLEPISPVTRNAKVIETSRRSFSPRGSSPRANAVKSPVEKRVTRESAKELNAEHDRSTTESTPTPKTDTEEYGRRPRTPASLPSKRRSESDMDPTPKRAKGGGAMTPNSLVKLEIKKELDTHTDHSLRSRDKLKEVPKCVVKLDQNNVISPNNTNLDRSCRSDTSQKSVTPVSSRKARLRHDSKETPTEATPKSETRTELPVCINNSEPGTPVGASTTTGEESCDNLFVETPRWRTKILTSLYIMEGTENLDDEIFLKRHGKPELEEKRRKRWDLQRMRQQRQYEKLRERYEGRQAGSDQDQSTCISLWPSAESAQFVCVDDTLPVCAFGKSLPELQQSEFFLPWLQSKMNSSGIVTRRRKR